MTFSLPSLVTPPVLPALSAAPSPPTRTRVCPWVSALAYRLVPRFVLPFQFAKIHITGQENLPRRGAVLLTPTHRSRWDSVIVPYATGRWVTGRDLYFMVSSNEMEGFQGWWVKRLGGFPVNTQKPGRSSIQRGVELLRRQLMMVVFPEGDIFRDGAVHPLKAGPAHMALQAAKAENMTVSLVPIALHYSDPEVKRGCEVTVKIGKPLQAQAYDRTALKSATQALTADLAAALEQLNQDLQPPQSAQ